MDTTQAARLREAVRWAAREEASDDSHWRQQHWSQLPMADFHAAIDAGNVDGNEVLVPVTCNTFGCIAGHIVHKAGDRLVVDKSYYDDEAYQPDHVITSWCVDEEGTQRPIAQRASQLLGVPEPLTYDLFSASSSLSGVVHEANWLLEEFGHAPLHESDWDVEALTSA